LHEKLFNRKKYDYFLQQYPNFKLDVALLDEHKESGDHRFWNAMFL